jgi:hypothetical protein
MNESTITNDFGACQEKKSGKSGFRKSAFSDAQTGDLTVAFGFKG